jgi:hypothetical protein
MAKGMVLLGSRSASAPLLITGAACILTCIRQRYIYCRPGSRLVRYHGLANL